MVHWTGTEKGPTADANWTSPSRSSLICDHIMGQGVEKFDPETQEWNDSRLMEITEVDLANEND